MAEIMGGVQDRRLLVVDDDLSQLRTLTAIMKGEGFEVLGCSTGFEALEHFNGGGIGVAIVDLRLPDIGGIELLERLQDAASDVHVIVHTAYSSFESAKSAVNRGAFAYVEKTDEPDELVRHVHRAFRARLQRYAEDLESAVAQRTRELEAVLQELKLEIADRKRAEEALRESQQRFETLADTLPQTVYECDADGKLTYVNRRGFEAFGYTAEDFEKGVHAVEMLAPEDRTRGAQMLAEVMGGKIEPTGREYLARRKDGSTFPVVIYSSPIVRGKQPAGLRGIIVDITECKRVEEARVKAVAAITEAMVDGILVLDLEGRVTSVNPTYLRMFGLEINDCLGKPFIEIPGIEDQEPEEMAKFLPLFEEAIRTGGSRHAELTIVARPGKEVPVSVNGGVIRDAQGNPTHLVVAIRDVSERKRAEEAVRRSEKMQAEAEKLAATGRMAAQIAHEINNPLAGIKNCFRLIRDAVPEDHPDRDMVGLIEREIDRVTHVVQQMYKLHSPQAERPTDILVEETIRDVLLMLEPLGRAHEVAVELAPVSPKLTVKAPEGSLQQVLYNLTVNAIQASPRSGIINILAEPTDKDYVRISIRDRGPGIPAEVQDRMFEPFFSADTGSRAKEGIGLGLSIVRSIVESLEGKIEFESKVGKGACFHVYLPSKQL